MTDQYGKKTDRNNMTTHDKVSTREPNNKKALETGSGIAWSEWVGLLQEYKDLNHTDMAKVVYEIIMERGLSKSPEWWAQGVTVAYEKYIGRRKLGQQSNDSFSVTVSKTFTGDMDEALTRWLQLVDGVHEFDSVKLLGSPRFSKTEKWRYWRCSLEDGSVVAVNIQTKPGGEKSGVAVNHDKLSNESDVERWRKYWKQFVLSYGV